MRTIEAEEARAQFAALLRDGERGETIVITRDRRPIARLGPIDHERAERAAAIEERHRYRREHRPTLGGVTIRELIEDGRDRRCEWLVRSRSDEDDRGE